MVCVTTLRVCVSDAQPVAVQPRLTHLGGGPRGGRRSGGREYPEIGVPQGVAEELEAVPLGELGHLRQDYRLPAAAAQPRQVGVVDNALPGRLAPVRQGFVQKALHGETVDAAVDRQLVEIARIVVNDGAPREIAQVLRAVAGCGR